MSQRAALKPAYAIWGEDRGKVERAVARLQDRVRGEGGLPADVFDAAVDSADDIAGTCETLSFGGLRLVIVRQADVWRADDTAALVSYLEAPNPQTCLAFISAVSLTPKLVAAVERVGEVLQFGPDPKARRNDRTKWFVAHVRSECERSGGQLPAPLARLVVERVGEDAMMLSQEAAKLALASGREPVTRELVDVLVVPNPEARAYELADALAAGERRKVFALLDDLASGDHAAEPIVIQSGLARHFRAVAAASALGPGADAEDVSTLTGLKGYPATKALEQARRLGDEVGARCVARLADLELDLRISSLAGLGASADDGRRFVLERAARDLLQIIGSGS